MKDAYVYPILEEIKSHVIQRRNITQYYCCSFICFVIYYILCEDRLAKINEEDEMDEGMSGKEIINLIDILQQKNMSNDEIIEIIQYIEKHEPEKK